MARFLLGFFALVGGFWLSASAVGCWCWIFAYTSSEAWVTLGARLLIRDLMCFVPVCSSSYLLVSLLLSAVIGTTHPRLACGIGIAGRTRVVLTLTSVLDLLYLKYTLRDLVCWLGLN